MEIWNPWKRHDINRINSMAMMPLRRGLSTLAIACLTLVSTAPGCRKSSEKPDSTINKEATMSSDLAGLQRLIKVPGGVKRCEWQTGKSAGHGSDWWVAAVLDVDASQIDHFLQSTATKAIFETPPGMKLESSFVTLKTLPDSQPSGLEGIRVVTDVYEVQAYASSPLLTGKAIRLSATQVMVVLWTN